MSEAKLNRALTEMQRDLLAKIGPEWARAPKGAKSPTLLSLQKRGLIEGRVNPKCGGIALELPWHSFAFDWRLKPVFEER